MPCDTTLKPGKTLKQRQEDIAAALKKLEVQMLEGRARLTIAPNGAVGILDWDGRDGVTDVCAFRTLSSQNSWALRQAVARAEAMEGRKVNSQAVAAGHHTHDGGKTWSKH